MEYKSLDGSSAAFANASISEILNQVSTGVIGFAVLCGFIMLGYFLSKRVLSSANPAELKRSSQRLIGIVIVVLGILMAYSVLEILYKNFTKSDIGFGAMSTSTYTALVSPQASNTPPVILSTCTDPNLVITQLSSGKLCSGTCSSANGCNLSSYMSIIKDESTKAGVDYRAIAALICRESSGNATKEGTLAQNGKKDCGLMQINRDICDPGIMDPRTNIQEGIKLFKQKLSSVSSYSYGGGITKEMLAFASYNCCSNGTIPSAPSVDCTTGTGFPFSIPKWACPINPGDSKFNMCAVRAYACDVAACMERF